MPKRILSILFAVLMLCTAILPVSAEDSNYNDTTIQWGEHTTHVYDYCTDRSCNICGAIRTSEHVYANVCDADCDFCGAIRDVPGHQYDYNCDADCNLCGEVREIRHIYLNACDPTCNLCGVTREVDDHVYDDSWDTDCNECGVTRNILTIVEQPHSVCAEDGAEVKITFTATGDGLTYQWYYAKKTGGTFYKSSSGVGNTFTLAMSSTRNGYNVYCTVTDQYGNSMNTDTVVLHMLPHQFDNDCDSDCNVCGDTREVGDHVYDTDCDNDCNVCGAIRTIQHVYDNVCDATCNLCGAERQVADHFYDNACDNVCNICGAIRTIQHVYDNACDTTCNVCGDTRKVGDHVYDNACDANCNECGILRQVPDHVYDNGNDTDCNVCGNHRDACNHQYDNACDADCNVPGCGYVRVVGDHVYDNACDADCNTCGALREVGDHVYDHGCDPDCNICGALREIAHVYTNECDTDCNVCGASREVGEHIYDNACDTDCNECGATRTTQHIYDNACDATCNLCGAERQVGDHVYTNACDTECNVCGAVRSVTHNFAPATCTTPKTCKICGITEGDPAAHNFVYAKCDENQHWNQCHCGAEEFGSRADHNYSLTQDDTYHWMECSCGYALDEVLHDYTDATCTAPKTCKICAATQGEPLAHNYTILKYDDDKHWWECVCGAEELPYRVSHGYTRHHDETHHWLQCSDCGYRIDEETHRYDNACDATCNVCFETRTVGAHVWSKGKCSVCSTASPSKVVITTAPKTTYGKEGATVKLTVKATGEGLKYTWYIKNSGGTKYSKSSVTSATYSVKISDASHGRYVYCVVSDKYGNEVKTTTVLVRRQATITKEPATVAYAKKGAKASIKITAKGDGLKYAWYVKNASASKYTKSSITSATYTATMSSSVKGRKAYCIVTDKYGKTVQSKTFLIRESVSVTTQPKSVTVKKNATAKVTIKASGDGLKYTWYVKKPGAKKYTKVSGTAKAYYSLKMTSKVKNTQVYCVVTDKYGNTVKSSTVKLKMK